VTAAAAAACRTRTIVPSGDGLTTRSPLSQPALGIESVKKTVVEICVKDIDGPNMSYSPIDR
jgi:hypothetical protein